jgi:hypothetical protein
MILHKRLEHGHLPPNQSRNKGTLRANRWSYHLHRLRSPCRTEAPRLHKGFPTLLALHICLRLAKLVSAMSETAGFPKYAALGGHEKLAELSL